MQASNFSERPAPSQNLVVQDVKNEKERLVREQNESLREQLSQRYNQQLMFEKENQGKAGNYDAESHNMSTVSQAAHEQYQQQ